jgi:hypothetical protein
MDSQIKNFKCWETLKVQFIAESGEIGEQIMRFDEVRQAIIQEWLDLDPKDRQSEGHAQGFVTKAARRHAFDPAQDPFPLIMRWLNPYIPHRMNG